MASVSPAQNRQPQTHRVISPPQCLARRARRPRRRADRRRPIFRRGARGADQRALDRLHPRLGPRQPHPAGRRKRHGRRRLSGRLYRFPQRAGEAAAAARSFISWSGTIRSSMPSSASCFRRSRCAGARRGRCASASTTTCRSAPRSIRRSSWSTTRWRSRAGSTSPPGAGTRASTGSTIRSRVDLAGVPYPPFHDVQAMVDGKAAPALAELARERWTRGACERAPPIQPGRRSVAAKHQARPDRHRRRHRPHLSRQSTTRGRSARSRRCSSTWSIAPSACIYIENQYLTSKRFAERLAQRMKERPRARSRASSRRSTRIPGWRSRPCRPGSAASCRSSRDAGVSERVALPSIPKCPTTDAASTPWSIPR